MSKIYCIGSALRNFVRDPTSKINVSTDPVFQIHTTIELPPNPAPHITEPLLHDVMKTYLTQNGHSAPQIVLNIEDLDGTKQEYYNSFLTRIAFAPGETLPRLELYYQPAPDCGYLWNTYHKAIYLGYLGYVQLKDVRKALTETELYDNID